MVEPAVEQIVLAEHQSRTVEGLPAAVARAFAATGAVTAGRDIDGALRLTASSHVGLVRSGGFELVVRPKVGVGRLLWLLGHARDPAGWRDDDAGLDEHDDLVAVVAVAFAHRAGRALAPGVLRGYQPVAETLLEGEQLRVFSARALDAYENENAVKGADPGAIVALQGGSMVIQCGKGLLAVTEVQRPGRRPVSVGDLSHSLTLEGRRLG